MSPQKMKPERNVEALQIVDAVPVPVAKISISNADLTRAAATLGMCEVGAKKLRAANLIGRHVNQIGVIETAAGQTLATIDGMDQMIAAGIKLGADAANIEEYSVVVKAVCALASVKNRNVESLVKISENGLFEKLKRDNRPQAFPIGMTVTAEKAVISAG